MKSLTFKQYTWIHSILSFTSLYALIVRYEFKDLFYKDTYRITLSDKLLVVPIFFFFSFVTIWAYYYYLNIPTNIITNGDYKRIFADWVMLIIINLIISYNLFLPFSSPFGLNGFLFEFWVVLGNILISHTLLRYVSKISIKKA
jgi:hypothetical protein